MPNDQTLFKYQAEGVAWISKPRTNNYGFNSQPLYGLIGDEMGLGKTAQALVAVRPLVERGKRILFIVPGATIIQWQRQFDRWILDCEPDDFSSNSLYALRSSTQLIPNGVSVILSQSLLAKHEVVEKLVALNFDGIVIDEIHKFGSRDTKRIKHLWALINLSESHFSEARIALSGTPVRNYAQEIYNIAHFVGPNHFRNFEDFSRKYLTWDHKALWNPQQFHSDFSPFYLRRTVSEVQKDLPAHRRVKLYTEISDPFIRSAYNKQVNLLSNYMNNAKKVDSMSILGYLVKLRHITGIAKAKEPSIIEPILDYLEESSEAGPQKVVIGIHHHFVAERLENSLQPYKIFHIRGGMDMYQKEQTKLDFIRYPEAAALLLSIKAGGEGIDGLQECCHKSYVFERQWNGADEKQFEKRISRTGQKLPTTTEYTIAVGTIDEFFDEMVEYKTKITNSVENADWQADPHFMKDLAFKVIRQPLRGGTGEAKRRNEAEKNKDFELIQQLERELETMRG